MTELALPLPWPLGLKQCSPCSLIPTVPSVPTARTAGVSFYLFIFWLFWVFVAVHGLSLLEVSRGSSSLQCSGVSLHGFSSGARLGCLGAVVAARRLSSCGSWA